MIGLDLLRPLPCPCLRDALKNHAAEGDNAPRKILCSTLLRRFAHCPVLALLYGDMKHEIFIDLASSDSESSLEDELGKARDGRCGRRKFSVYDLGNRRCYWIDASQKDGYESIR